MQPVSVDAGVAGGGLGLATWAGTISSVLQVVILVMTIVLIGYRIRNAKDRAKGEE